MSTAFTCHNARIDDASLPQHRMVWLVTWDPRAQALQVAQARSEQRKPQASDLLRQQSNARLLLMSGAIDHLQLRYAKLQQRKRSAQAFGSDDQCEDDLDRVQHWTSKLCMQWRVRFLAWCSWTAQAKLYKLIWAQVLATVPSDVTAYGAWQQLTELTHQGGAVSTGLKGLLVCMRATLAGRLLKDHGQQRYSVCRKNMIRAGMLPQPWTSWAESYQADSISHIWERSWQTCSRREGLKTMELLFVMNKCA